MSVDILLFSVIVHGMSNNMLNILAAKYTNLIYWCRMLAGNFAVFPSVDDLEQDLVNVEILLESKHQGADSMEFLEYFAKLQRKHEQNGVF